MHPLIHNVSFEGTELRPDVSIRLEVNAECLPFSLHPVVHFTWEKGRHTVDFDCIFVTTLHPFYAFGKKGQDDDILDRLGGIEKATEKASIAIERKCHLRVCRVPYYLELTLEVKGAPPLRGILVEFSKVTSALYENTRRIIPPPRESRVQRRSPTAVNLDAQQAFHGPKAKVNQRRVC